MKKMNSTWTTLDISTQVYTKSEVLPTTNGKIRYVTYQVMTILSSLKFHHGCYRMTLKNGTSYHQLPKPQSKNKEELKSNLKYCLAPRKPKNKLFKSYSRKINIKIKSELFAKLWTSVHLLMLLWKNMIKTTTLKKIRTLKLDNTSIASTSYSAIILSMDK